MTLPTLRARRWRLAGATAAATALGAALVVPTVAAGGPAAPTGSGPRFAVTISPAVRSTPTTGRAYAIVARAGDLSGDEPRDHIDVIDGVPFWGVDVNALAPGGTVAIGNTPDVAGYPLASTADLPAGDYLVQPFLNVYEQATRPGSPPVWLHFPCGDGGDLWSSPGNLYGDPVHVTVTPGQKAKIPLLLSHVVQPSQPVPPGGTCQQGNPADSPHVKHVKIRSTLLSAFWGRPIYIGADVLLPRGYGDPANAATRYPMEVREGHYPSRNPHGFVESLSNDFSRWWVSADAPRFLSVQLRTENPFYDDSYTVDSANLGPYGSAVQTELLPYLDAQFRSIGQGWGRVLTGGSTGGWVSLANMVQHPDSYAAVWSGYPDSLDFHAHQLIDLYDDPNAYVVQHAWDATDRPAAREVSGDTIWTTPQENHWELAMGTHGRSMGQWDVWQAVFGPRGTDGYPAAVWDKQTGVIDHAVAARWAPYDLTKVVAGNWSTLGPKLAGRVTVYVGDADTYFLNDGVNLFAAGVSTLTSPAPNFTFLYGRNQPHGWQPWTDPQLFQIMAQFIVEHAPRGTSTAWAGAAARQAKPAVPPGGVVTGGVVLPGDGRR